MRSRWVAEIAIYLNKPWGHGGMVDAADLEN